MNYKEFNDYELLDQIHSCSEDANEILLYKYRPLIVSIAKKYIKYSHGGVDLNDLIQEGLLGLNDAINSFRDEKNANFGTYAKICVQRKIANLIKSTMSYKNKILNDYIPIDNDEDEPIDYFLADNSKNPINMVEDYDFQNRLLDNLNEKLSDIEKEVFELKLSGFSYKEIANLLEKDSKSIDNCIQRIKTKFKKVLEEIK
ncbi:MAG: sigma-70 family RNA polymerase sigma factor [Firmicutes bacterium]|nr:sigma-70 family RNA polymerase sigma factor [Bacillota bacterium]